MYNKQETIRFRLNCSISNLVNEIQKLIGEKK